jgi:hypothetical protein
LIESPAGTFTDVVMEHVVVLTGTVQVRAVAVELVPAMR